MERDLRGASFLFVILSPTDLEHNRVTHSDMCTHCPKILSAKGYIHERSFLLERSIAAWDWKVSVIALLSSSYWKPLAAVSGAIALASPSLLKRFISKLSYLFLFKLYPRSHATEPTPKTLRVSPEEGCSHSACLVPSTRSKMMGIDETRWRHRFSPSIEV